MVIQQYQVALFQAGVQAAGGVAQQQVLDTQGLQHPHRKSDLLHAVAFIIMEAPLQNNHFMRPQPARNQFTFVGFYGGMREMRNILVRDPVIDGQLADE